MSTNLPLLLSVLAHYISIAYRVIYQLYVHAAFYADVTVNWLLTNILVYASSFCCVFTINSIDFMCWTNSNDNEIVSCHEALTRI